MDLQLDAKAAVVTGASKGIALAVVRALAAEGAHVNAFFHPEPRTANIAGSNYHRWRTRQDDVEQAGVPGIP